MDLIEEFSLSASGGVGSSQKGNLRLLGQAAALVGPVDITSPYKVANHRAWNGKGKPMIRILIAAVALMASAAFAAEDIPLSTMTCKQFVGAPKESTAVILTWMMGFLQDVDEPAVISFSKMEALGNKLKNHCDQNPSQPLMTALDKVTDEDSK